MIKIKCYKTGPIFLTWSIYWTTQNPVVQSCVYIGPWGVMESIYWTIIMECVYWTISFLWWSNV